MADMGPPGEQRSRRKLTILQGRLPTPLRCQRGFVVSGASLFWRERHLAIVSSRVFPYRIHGFEPEKRPSKKQANTLFSLTVDGLRSSTAFGERESESGILGPKTASGGQIRPQFAEMPKRPGLRHRLPEKRRSALG